MGTLTAALPAGYGCPVSVPQYARYRSSVVIYSIVIRSFSTRFPFQKGKNEGNISKNDMIKNDSTSSHEGAQSNVVVNIRHYRKAGERRSKLAKGGVKHHGIKSKFCAKWQAFHRKVTLLPLGLLQRYQSFINGLGKAFERQASISAALSNIILKRSRDCWVATPFPLFRYEVTWRLTEW